jgi:hypothetical protein
VQTYPVADSVTLGLRDDVSASLAGSYQLPSDTFVSSLVVTEPQLTASSSSLRRLLTVAVEVGMVVLGNVTQIVDVSGITAASLVSLFVAQLADHSFVSNSTGAVILPQSVTVVGWTLSSSSSTGAVLRSAGQSSEGSQLSAGQTAGIVIGVVAAVTLMTAAFLWMQRRGCGDRCRKPAEIEYDAPVPVAPPDRGVRPVQRVDDGKHGWAGDGGCHG